MNFESQFFGFAGGEQWSTPSQELHVELWNTGWRGSSRGKSLFTLLGLG